MGRMIKVAALVAGVGLVVKLARADYASEDAMLFPHGYDPFCDR